MNDKELMKKLKEVFVQEARERLSSMSSNLVTLEQETSPSEQTPLFEEVYRDAHSLKGASRSIGLNGIESIFQILEDIFNEVKEGQFNLTAELFDILQDFIKTLNKIIESPEIESPENVQILKKAEELLVDYLSKSDDDTKDDKLNLDDIDDDIFDIESETAVSSDPVTDTSNMTADEESAASTGEIVTDKKLEESVEKVEKVESAEPTKPTKPAKPAKPAVSKKSEDKEEPSAGQEEEVTSSSLDTVRISSKKLDSLLLKSENMIRIKQMFYEHIPIVYKTLSMIDEYKQISGSMTSDYLNIKQELVDTEGRDRRKSRKSLEKIIGCVEENNNSLKLLENELKELLYTEKENHRNTGKIVDGFLYDVKEIAMLPFSNILFAFPIMVRDISKELEKNISFRMKGEEIKLDRRILQEIKNPLVHLIRNSIDHGIENPSDRKAVGKEDKGSVELIISQSEGNKILIKIRDDGKGINVDVIKEKIIDNNLLSLNEANLLTDSQILEYIFHSGFSTKEIITDLSGRGLGMAIVKDKIESLGGKVFLNSEKGKYSEVEIVLPVTLATFKGVLVETAKKTFVIPSSSLEEAVRVQSDCVKSVENKRTIFYNNLTYPLIRLTSVLGINENNVGKDKKYVTAAIISKSNELMALEIDDIIEEQEILIKDFGSQLKKVTNLTGATILNSGRIVPILNIQDLFKSATNLSTVPRLVEKKTKPDDKKTIITNKQTMLVVEDSITSRILLKNILESAGYNTETAVDGVDALNVLKSKKIDLVVSDIEMPRMDGFTLTSQIKADKNLKNLPMVLVTSRSTLADKERGAEVGADAYIVKSEFDQTNLLDILKTLL